MPFTEHQLSIPSANIPLSNPLWAEETLEAFSLALGVSEDEPMPLDEVERQFPEIVRLAIVESAAGYGPRDTVQEVLWTSSKHAVRCWRLRPGSGYKAINLGTPDELPGESGSPDQYDARGLAIQLGKEAQFDAAIAAAWAKTNAVVAAEKNIRDAAGEIRSENDPKVVRISIKERLSELKNELSGAAAANRARNRPPSPVGRPDGAGMGGG